MYLFILFLLHLVPAYGKAIHPSAQMALLSQQRQYEIDSLPLVAQQTLLSVGPQLEMGLSKYFTAAGDVSVFVGRTQIQENLAASRNTIATYPYTRKTLYGVRVSPVVYFLNYSSAYKFGLRALWQIDLNKYPKSGADAAPKAKSSQVPALLLETQFRYVDWSLAPQMGLSGTFKNVIFQMQVGFYWGTRSPRAAGQSNPSAQ